MHRSLLCRTLNQYQYATWVNSPPLLHNKRKCNHAAKNTPGQAHAISIPNRDVSSGSSPDTLFAKLADRLLPDTSPHPSTPGPPPGATLAASTRIQKCCPGFGVCTLPVCCITCARWLPVLAVRARRHILIYLQRFSRPSGFVHYGN